MKQNITVVSLGPGDPELLTAQSLNTMKKAKRLIFRTAQHPVYAALTEAGVQSTSLDDYYDRYEDFDEMHRDMAKALWTEAEHHAVVFAVLDAGTDGAVRELRAQQPQDAVLRILPGVTLADACIAQLPGNLAPIGALRTIPAEDAVTAAADPTTPLLITEIWNRSLACDLKLRLCDVYGDELPTVLFPSTVKTNRKPQNIQLWEMAEQREEIFHRIRKFRQTKAIFSMDFQNDAQFVGGCIAGGRRYLHINAKGDVEPCVFIHYSNANIHDCSLLDALKSPLFQAYHDNQPFNDNMLRPCPMLENPDKLGEMVKESKAVNTDYQSPETPEHLKEKAAPYAENWTPTAEKLWNEEKEKIEAKKNA